MFSSLLNFKITLVIAYLPRSLFFNYKKLLMLMSVQYDTFLSFAHFLCYEEITFIGKLKPVAMGKNTTRCHC